MAHCDDKAKPATTSELISLVEKLEARYVSWVGADSSCDFLHHLRVFWAELTHAPLWWGVWDSICCLVSPVSVRGTMWSDTH